jgi:thiol:disulfide interchange protein
VEWETSLATAMQKSKASKKPILMDVYATWCGPCKMMDKNTYANATVVTESKKWIMLKIDGDKDEKLAARYGVQGFPTTLFLKSDGKAIAGFVGYAGPAEMLKQMRAAEPKAR